MPFDPIRAQREIVAGLADVHKVLLARFRQAELELAEAEANANALAKLERFVADLLKEASAKLHALETEAASPHPQ
jgi:hypothetical protein